MEVIILTVILNYLLKFFWGTRAMDVVFGFIAFLFLFLIATWFGLPVLEKIMLNVVNVAVIAVFIIFMGSNTTGEQVTAELVRKVIDDVMAEIEAEVGDAYAKGRWADARDVFEQVALADDFVDFLTLPAYALLD